MFGGTPERNMVNLTDKNIPRSWNVEDGKRKNVKWIVQLGNYAYGGPVVADGKIFVGTNNAVPRDPKNKSKDKAVLMAFNEADGKFLWQNVHDIPPTATSSMTPSTDGMCSTPVVEGQRLYYVTPGCEVICADNATGKTVWRYDLMKEQKVVPYHCCNCSPLVVDDLVMVVTSNGVDEEGKVTSPKAPSFVAVNKKTGKLAWQQPARHQDHRGPVVEPGRRGGRRQEAGHLPWRRLLPVLLRARNRQADLEVRLQSEQRPRKAARSTTTSSPPPSSSAIGSTSAWASTRKIRDAPESAISSAST